MAKKIDPKAKAKRQKIYAAIGGVLLLGLLAFQVPRTMKMLHPKVAESAAPSTPASASSATTGPIAAPSLSGGNAAPVAATAASGELGDPDVPPTPQSGQLLAFGRFRSKDPFSQQIHDCTGDPAACPATASSGSGSPTAKPPAKKPKTDGATGAAPASSTTTPTSSAAAQATSAKIMVNGVAETVGVGTQFPASDPTFTLIGLTSSSAKIGIAGGSLESGSSAVTLKKGTPLTLMNTADGTRYVLRLISVG
jgi:hypothetical protein